MARQKNDSYHSNETEQLIQTRLKQLNQIRDIIAKIEPRLQKVIRQERQLKLLESVSLGLYEEIDKLSKKVPSEPVTDLVLTQMNEVIREVKELVTDDSYVQRLQEFVPAGDNPEHRDAVVVMRQVRQGLSRFSTELKPLTTQLSQRLKEAKIIEGAIQIYLDDNTTVTKTDLKDYDIEFSSLWLTGYGNEFNFSKLDKINIATYFEISDE